MKCLLPFAIMLPFLACGQSSDSSTAKNQEKKQTAGNPASTENPYATIGDITLPPGYSRLEVKPHSFEAWLRARPLKKDKTIYLYNGLKKSNQGDQFAIIDISVGNKDFQQCADAIMRLRAEYFYEQKAFSKIIFSDNAGIHYRYEGGSNRKAFYQYLELVFSRCGTLSLQKELRRSTGMEEAMIGDVLVRGGSPGHAMILVDMAVNREGRRIYLLAQGFMPAQSVHIVRNPGNPLSPWYLAENDRFIYTPSCVFSPSDLKHW